VSDEDAAYQGDRLTGGGLLVTAHVNGTDRQLAQEMFYRNGGHSASPARAAVI
jgi:hypothetical protein